MLQRAALVFRTLLAALFASTCMALWIALVRRADFLAAFPGAERPEVYVGMIIIALIGLVALTGLWRWKSWSIALYGISGGFAVALDIIARAPIAHRLTVVTMAVLVLLLAYANRHQFMQTQARAA